MIEHPDPETDPGAHSESEGTEAGGCEPDHLYKHRAYLVQLAERTQAGVDKTVVTLATAALGFTLLVLKDVKQGVPVATPGYLTVAWIALTLSLGGSLLSLSFSGRLTAAEIASVDRMIRGDDDSHAHRKSRRLWTTATVWSNRIALASFFVGTVLALLFAHANSGI